MFRTIDLLSSPKVCASLMYIAEIRGSKYCRGAVVRHRIYDHHCNCSENLCIIPAWMWGINFTSPGICSLDLRRDGFQWPSGRLWCSWRSHCESVVSRIHNTPAWSLVIYNHSFTLCYHSLLQPPFICILRSKDYYSFITTNFSLLILHLINVILLTFTEQN